MDSRIMTNPQNTIPTRIFEFIRQFPPFKLMKDASLMSICNDMLVKYIKPGSVIFKQGDFPGDYLYFVREGAIQLYKEQNEERFLVEVCDEGDLFGIRPLMAEETYALTAEAQEESLLYAISIATFKSLMESNPAVALHMASTFAAGARPDVRNSKQAYANIPKSAGTFEGELIEVQSMEKSKAPVVCNVSTSIKTAAEIMTDKGVGSIIIVDDHDFPLGIITDKDLRSKIATGLIHIDEKVDVIMSSPVITVLPEVTVADIQIKMIKHNIHHLCLTEDGTDQSKVIGVLSEHDLLVIQGNNPAVLIREIMRTSAPEELKEIRDRAEDLLAKYLHQEVSIAYITTIISEINDALIRRSIELSVKELEVEGKPLPNTRFCWMTLGSEGREEQLLRTDQDNALVFADGTDEENELYKTYFLELAKKTTTLLNTCGFDFCPADMMASNPQWCLSLTDWKKQFSKWIYEPTPKSVMNGTIFFDFRPVYGDFNLANALTAYIFEQLDEQELFLAYLAKDALQNPPPLTFFRSFVVEKGGEHKNEFDIKARAMMPLTDAARLLILSNQIGGINNTFKRFEALAKKEPQNKELYEQAADAYELLIRIRALQGLKNKDSGRYIDPGTLSKMERLDLRNAFKPISEIQSLISTRFQLGFLR
ncbi:MAG: DUF294 nucleotidyltransferase-like domain-containing protein [Bacteroidota bacterium]